MGVAACLRGVDLRLGTDFVGPACAAAHAAGPLCGAAGAADDHCAEQLWSGCGRRGGALRRAATEAAGPCLTLCVVGLFPGHRDAGHGGRRTVFGPSGWQQCGASHDPARRGGQACAGMGLSAGLRAGCGDLSVAWLVASAPLALRLAPAADLPWLLPAFWVGFNLARLPAGWWAQRAGALTAMLMGATVAALGSAAAASALRCHCCWRRRRAPAPGGRCCCAAPSAPRWGPGWARAGVKD